ncbi:serine/threonine-protein kinase [Streptomyces misionensis]|uniref:serine/threonine-protein kinase n=1 Tax=Streptomyces misionensis TaxID=67331 RepID=UPI0033CB6FC1
MAEDGAHPPGARLIGGRYRLTDRLGTGPTGTVWRAWDEDGEGHGRVAVKEPLLPGDPAKDEESGRLAHRLYREARAATRVRHPCAVTVYDVVTEAGVPWIVMELVEGESLAGALRRGPLPPAEAARVGLAVLGALRAAHAVGIVHRDLKPANVLLESGTGRVVLTDFGIGDGPAGDAPAAFTAPDRAAGPGAGPASDLWSLGALLRTAVGDADPGALGPLLDRLLAERPEARPGAEQVAWALREYLGVGDDPDDVAGHGSDAAESTGAAGGTGGPEGKGAPEDTGVSGAAGASEVRDAPDAVDAAPEVPPGAEPRTESPAAPRPGPLRRLVPDLTAPRRRTPLAALGLFLAKKPADD